MIGIVLAAGAGRRLHPDTDNLPKTLLPVDGDRTILDVGLGNLAAVGLEEVVIVTGFAADRIEERRDELAQRYGLRIQTLFNPKAEEWNNAYSLWYARDRFAEGVLMVNGDTVHPASVEESVLAARGNDDLVIAVDDVKTLGDEEMKVHLSDEGQLDRIHKTLDPATAAGEYAALIWLSPVGALPLLIALAFRHYDLVYRLRHQGVAPPRWIGNLALGWDGRLVLGYILLVADALPAGFYIAAGLFATAFVAESIAGWRRFGRGQQPVTYEDEEDEGQ